MAMDQAIRDFPKQFSYRPKVVGPRPIRLGRKGWKYIVAGMGGSHLAADLLKTIAPELDIAVHQDYGLPFDLSRPGEGKGRGRSLVIASSYSGNTEETISAFEQAVKNNFPVAAIATGGKLIELAKRHQVPYIQMPDTGIQPRSALGFSLLALLKIMKQSDLLREAKSLAKSLDPARLEDEGRALAERMKNHAPVIYSSAKNFSLAYNWKIKFNETGKIPAFYNVFPELNHNEMTGYSAKGGPASGGDGPGVRGLMEIFHFIFLKDSADHPHTQKRMDITKKLYEARGLPVEVLRLSGESNLQKIFNSLLLADWTAFYTAQQYGLESEQVPMVEEFKKMIR